MVIRTAEFIGSSTGLAGCPAPGKPEFAFTGRSNVGKSSLINMLAGNRKLARISQSPGKTRTINHYLINKEWYLADLPGYGFSKMPFEQRKKWMKETGNYLANRKNLVCVFVLLDIRIKPQVSDLRFMEMLGINNIPFARIFTKSDKLSKQKAENNVKEYDRVMLETWEELPRTFISSSVTRAGREEILNFISELVNNYKKDV